MNPINKLLVLILIFVFTLTSDSAIPPKYGGVLRLAVFQNNLILDPTKNLTSIEYCISDSIFDGLVSLDRKGKVLPCIADSWTISDDKATYTFHISNSAKFHNGRKITSNDVKFSWQRSIVNVESYLLTQSSLWLIQGVSNYRSGKSREIEGLKIIDENNIQILLEKPDDMFLSGLDSPVAWIVPRESTPKGIFVKNPIGSGPFKIKMESLSENVILQLIANEDHIFGRPYLDGIKLIHITDIETALLQFETNEIDCLEIPNISYGRFRNNPAWFSRLFKSGDKQMVGIQVNSKSFPTKARISDILRYGIDVQSILNMLYNQGTAISNDYQPKRAEKLSQDSQVKLIKLIFFNSGDDIEKIADRIALDLSKIGIDVNISPLNRDNFQKALTDKAYSLALRTIRMPLGKVDDLNIPSFVPLFYYDTNVLQKSDVQYLPNLVKNSLFQFEDMYFLRLQKGE
ncbi:MAG: ABC transporter substrate-binding protein [Candidatus Poribacteria bacterium]